MNYETIILERKDNIATITLNRPDRMNSVNPQMTLELLAALDDVDQDDEMRVLVLTGAGRGFCAGADVGGMAGGAEKGLGTSKGLEMMQNRLSGGTGTTTLKLQKMQKPTIAMVNGVAVGGGAALALACDMRVGSENARFMNAFVRIGLYAGWGSTWLYPRMMGLGRALEYLFTGDFLEAKEAERLGVLNRLVPADELEKETMTLARKIADGPPIAIKLMKLAVYKGLAMDFETALQTTDYESITLSSEDHKEGITAFREKRPAKYEGK
ncbi:enoyl-CoA hydratase/isomerase family protein [Chloroflexota bacterium]